MEFRKPKSVSQILPSGNFLCHVFKLLSAWNIFMHTLLPPSPPDIPSHPSGEHPFFSKVCSKLLIFYHLSCPPIRNQLFSSLRLLAVKTLHCSTVEMYEILIYFHGCLSLVDCRQLVDTTHAKLVLNHQLKQSDGHIVRARQFY